jgi:uncharacterized membrane protein YkgB
MKKSVLSSLILLSSISLVKAASLSELLSSIDESMVVYFSIFILSFVLCFFALSKFFKDNRAFAGIIAAVISFLIVFGINKAELTQGFNVSDFFYNLGVSTETFSLIIGIIIVAGIVFLIIKMRRDSLYVLGGLLIVTSFFVYAKAILIIVGIILIGIRIFAFKDKGKFSNKGAGI